MKRRRGGRTSPMALWIDTMQSGLATLTTLSVRVPELMAGTMSPQERTRMVAEKVAAAHEGAVAASLLLGRMAARGAPTPADLMHLADVASRPARTRVKANAKRLGGKPRRGAS